MGIQGLLPLLDPVLEDVHIRQYSGKKVAIDGRTWLYRGAFGCAFELCMNLNTNKYVKKHVEFVTAQTLTFYHQICDLLYSNGSNFTFIQHHPHHCIRRSNSSFER